MADHDTSDDPTPSSEPRGDADESAAESARTSSEDGAPGKERRDEGLDLKGIVRQLTAPMIESLDTRLRDQIEAHVDDVLTDKIDAAIADRLSTIDRAIADLSRSVGDLERRLGARERDGQPS